MKKILKNKIILMIILCVLSCGIGITASNIYQSNSIEYSPTDSSWEVSNVNEALNDLYEKYKSSDESAIIVPLLNVIYSGNNTTETIVPLSSTSSSFTLTKSNTCQYGPLNYVDTDKFYIWNLEEEPKLLKSISATASVNSGSYASGANQQGVLSIYLYDSNDNLIGSTSERVISGKGTYTVTTIMDLTKYTITDQNVYIKLGVQALGCDDDTVSGVGTASATISSPSSVTLTYMTK